MEEIRCLESKKLELDLKACVFVTVWNTHPRNLCIVSQKLENDAVKTCTVLILTEKEMTAES